DTTSDLEGAQEAPTAPVLGQSAMAPTLRFDEADGTWVPATAPGDIRPGGTVVLPSNYSGHDAYGWAGTPGMPVADLGDFPPRTYAAVTRLDCRVLTLLGAFDEATAGRGARILGDATARLLASDED